MTMPSSLKFTSCLTVLLLLGACGSDTPATTTICTADGCRDSDRSSDNADIMSESLKAPHSEAITYRGEDIAELREKATQGDSKAAYLLGLVNLHGLADTSKSPTVAFNHFKQAAEAGMADAAYQAGLMALEGQGTYRDEAQAIRWLHQAADAGDARALWTLGIMYEQGSRVERNPNEAFGLFKAAADAGVPQAKHNLGLMYLTGNSVPADPYQAMVHLRSAAERGVVPAQRTMGLLLAQGLEGFPRDPREARRFLSMAAAKGDAIASQELQRVQQDLEGVEALQDQLDIERAYAYTGLYDHLSNWMIFTPYNRLFPYGYGY